ncbi:hypothetical protein E0Z10_g8688 [Xylaria hypoxylon]|uniref:Uncharacterized protein n=1 Tax=Xylaria hypoxylon TaxID=37992 RepID=A0A4Z0YUF1_9PEZI|nr:hypothetical protein E0Z10_g8688 [Xylaria hypoxylon]
MAPTSKAQPKPARSASGHTKKQHSASAPAPITVAPANRQHVVPAIPLAFMNKQFNNTRNSVAKSSPKHAQTAAPSSNGFPVPSLEAALISRDPLHSAKNSENEVKSQNMEKSAPALAAVSPSKPEKQPQLSPLQVNGVDHTNVELAPDVSSGVEAVRGESRLDFISFQSLNEAFSRSHLTGVNGNPLYASQPQSATSTTRPEFAPSFPPPAHPLQHQQHIAEQHHHPAIFHAPHPHHMHPHQHRQQISNGGIMFGGFDSHTPSPVPLLGGFLPPPHPPMNGENRGHPRPNGHHHTHSNSNGFPTPINTRFRGDMMSMSTMDGYGTVPAHTPPVHIEAYAPGAGRYGPPTPHSFHGSHTSGEPNGMENATLPYPPNGSYVPHSRHEHPAAHPHPPGPFPPFMPPQPMSRQFNTAEDEVMEGVRYIRSLFDNGELADCVLELISTKGRHHPVKISGHKLILARSPALKQHILTARARDRGTHTITMEIDDSYLRSDAWWTAVQRLYQHPLVPHMLGNAGNGVDFAGSKVDRFGFCLGYAAAGHVLAMQDVLIRGLEIAANSLTWETVEAGLGFVLENTIQRHIDHSIEPEEVLPSTYLEFGYGPETKILLSAILNFLINEFPPNFEFDTSVQDSPKIARIPMSAATTTTSTRTRTTDKVAPAIARGTTTRQNAKQARLSSIKFGDLPAAYPDDGTSMNREPAKCSSILSRILLNLPYDDLCEVLTSGSNGVSGWNSAQDRYHAVVDVVVEREARRLRAVEAVRSEGVPNARDIQSRLSAPHRYTIAESWDVLNWREEVTRDETPRIVRRWVPQFDVAPQPTPQRAPAPYDIPDSMV